ncbi:CBF-domain-containing protein, partial [Aureobasidium melanogenum]
DATAVAKPTKSKKVKAASNDGDDDPQAQMLLLEQQILESPSNYPNITSLLKFLKSKDATQEITAAVALCRTFCRLMAAERMVKQKTMDEEEIGQVDWLKTQYKEYGRQLGRLLASEELQSTALTLFMRLVKEETSQDGRRAEQAWRTGIFADLILGLVASPDATGAREEFIEKFVEEHDDVRYFTFYAVANILARSPEGYDRQILVSNALSLLLLIENAPDSDSQLEDWYGQTPEGRKHALLSLSSHRKTAQEAWLAIFRSALTKDERKSILHHLTNRIVPWFTKPESLMDFLTDSYNAGGATSLLALSGLFYLIAEKNLDYPAFYTKLYSLLDDTLLHSKHRSRFFRLLDTFMSSTHLPSALVASFIKRLSRLALHAPPAAIVVVVPWVYNMLLRHRTCTFMIHREVRGASQLKKLEAEGMDDSFSMDEMDPMETGAIDSSLWELETLASHYHPNVATLARIIQEQFTKKNYNMEDFLDHNYQGLIDAELGKEMKKTPVVEFEIPKRIITAEEGGLNDLGGLLQIAVQAL